MISYKPFFKLLVDKELKTQNIVSAIRVSSATLAKMRKNEYIALEVIERLCKYLNCQPGDLIEYIAD